MIIPVLSALIAAAIVVVTAGSARLEIVAAIAVMFATTGVVLIARRPSVAVVVLFVAGTLLLDFGSLAIYRYFLVSDALLLLAVALQFRLNHSSVVYFPALLTAAFGVYLLGLLIALAGARDLAGVSTWLHFAFLALVLLPAVTTLFVRRPELQRYFFVAVVATAIVQSAGLAAAIARGLPWQSGSRLTGVFGSSALWVYVASAAGLAAIALAGPLRMKLLSVPALGLVAAAEMFLRSRMLWIASIVAIGVMAILQARRPARGLLLVAVVCASMAGAYVAGWYPGAIQRRIAETLRPNESGDLVARIQAVHDLAGAIEQSDGVGIGLGQSEGYLRDQKSPALVVNIHNIILHAAVEGGLLAAVGLTLLPLGVGVLWRRAAQLTDVPVGRFLTNWQVSTLVGIYIGAQLTPTLYEHTLYVLLAALAAHSVSGIRPPTAQNTVNS